MIAEALSKIRELLTPYSKADRQRIIDMIPNVMLIAEEMERILPALGPGGNLGVAKRVRTGVPEGRAETPPEG